MAQGKKYVKAKWYENSLKYQKEYRKDKILVSFRVKEELAKKFRDICKKNNTSHKDMILQELYKLNKIV